MTPQEHAASRRPDSAESPISLIVFGMRWASRDATLVPDTVAPKLPWTHLPEPCEIAFMERPIQPERLAQRSEVAGADVRPGPESWPNRVARGEIRERERDDRDGEQDGDRRSSIRRRMKRITGPSGVRSTSRKRTGPAAAGGAWFVTR